MAVRIVVWQERPRQIGHVTVSQDKRQRLTCYGSNRPGEEQHASSLCGPVCLVCRTDFGSGRAGAKQSTRVAQTSMEGRGRDVVEARTGGRVGTTGQEEDGIVGRITWQPGAGMQSMSGSRRGGKS